MPFMHLPTGVNKVTIAFTLALSLLIPATSTSQTLPVIHARSSQADIRDGKVFQKGIWNLSPDVKPDIYYSLAPASEKEITFYTDIDSISFHTLPGNRYDFIIMLNGTDSCYTQISTMPPAPPPALLSSAVLSKQDQQKDFAQFRQALEKEHAGLYRYTNKDIMDRLFDSCSAALQTPLPVFEFAKPLLFILSSIRDGHTGTNFSRALVSEYRTGEKLFPMAVYFIEHKAYALCHQVKEVPAGTEILSINGETMEAIQDKLFQYLPADGTIETKKRQTVNSGAFPFLYRWVYGKVDSFVVRFQTNSGEQTVVLPAALFEEESCEPPVLSNVRQDLQLDFPKPGTALLTIKTFDDRRFAGRYHFKHFLDSCFTTILLKDTRQLIVDLRDNAGGTDEYPALLYSYLATKPFRLFSSVESVERKIKLEENILLQWQTPQENNYKGSVVILINGRCFSATADFCAIARSENRAVFVGEETGGGYEGNSSGQFSTVVLPESQLAITIPRFSYMTDVKPAKIPGRGILPDHEVIPNIGELLDRKDVQLAFALALAAEK